MAAGRKPAPLEERRRHGVRPGRDSGDRPLPDAVVVLPAARAGVPEPPVDLGLAGRDVWSKVFEAGVSWLADSDLMKLAETCQVADDLAAARRRYRVTTEPADGRIVAVLSKTFSAGLSELGLDPTARGRLGVAEVKAQSAFEALLERRADRG